MTEKNEQNISEKWDNFKQACNWHVITCINMHVIEVLEGKRM